MDQKEIFKENWQAALRQVEVLRGTSAKDILANSFARTQAVYMDLLRSNDIFKKKMYSRTPPPSEEVMKQHELIWRDSVKGLAARFTMFGVEEATAEALVAHIVKETCLE